MEESGQPQHRAKSPPPVHTEMNLAGAHSQCGHFGETTNLLPVSVDAGDESQTADCGLYSLCGHPVTACALRGGQRCR